MSAKTRRLQLLTLGTGALVWLSWLWGSTNREPSHGVADATNEKGRDATFASVSSKPHTQTLARDRAAAAKRDDAPVIYEISVDKPFVCRGEENFVNVRAEGPDGSDAHLRVSLEGTSSVGSRIPFRLYSNGEENRPRVLVEGRGGKQVTAPLPAVKVNDCEVPQTAEIDLVALAASTNEWRFTGHVTGGAFKAESYEWDFGDGTRLVSADPAVVHSYRFRSQDKRYSNFLIALTMRRASGESLRTSRALGIANPAFGRLIRHGEVAVFSERRDEAGGQEFTRLYHAYHEPVRIEQVALRIRSLDGRTEDLVGNYSPQESIGVAQLLPGEPAQVRLALADMQLPSTRPLLLVFELKGSTTDGIPASGVFSTQLL